MSSVSINRLFPTRLVLSSGSLNIGAVTMPRFPLPDKFSDGDFPTFSKLFSRVAAANSWTDTEQLSALPLCLQGRALSVFEKNEANFKTTSDALKCLEEEFNATFDRDAALKDFYQYSWGHGLDLDAYAQRLSNLLRRGLPSLGNDDHNRIVSNQFINGFPSHISEKLRLLFSGRTPKIADVIAAAKDITKLGTPVAACLTSNDSLQEKVNDISQKLELVTTEVAAITSEMRTANWRNTTRERQPQKEYGIRCFNCSGLGHIARNCPSPRSRDRNFGSRAVGATAVSRTFNSGNGTAAGGRPTPRLQ